MLHALYDRMNIYLFNVNGLTNIYFLWCKNELWVSDHMDGLVQDSSNCIVNALELLQSCTKPLIYAVSKHTDIPALLPGSNISRFFWPFSNYENILSISDIFIVQYGWV